jgi:hypothetical protein
MFHGSSVEICAESDIDSGIHVGAGKNAAGKLVNAGQQITREEAVRLYTAENGWFLKEENKLGSIEEGKLGDVVVLSDDYFDPVSFPMKRSGSSIPS